MKVASSQEAHLARNVILTGKENERDPNSPEVNDLFSQGDPRREK